MRTRSALCVVATSLLLLALLSRPAFAQPRGGGRGGGGGGGSTTYLDRAWTAAFFELKCTREQLTVMLPELQQMYEERKAALVKARQTNDYQAYGNLVQQLQQRVDDLFAKTLADDKPRLTLWTTYRAQFLIQGRVGPGMSANAAAAFMANWPQFRGPNGTGFCARENVITRWSEKTGENILWKVPLTLPGAGSPIAWRDRVFLSGSDGVARKVFCFDAKSLDLLWANGYPDTGARDPADLKEDYVYAAPTPVTDGQGVVGLFANGDIACFDFAGKLRWSRNLGGFCADAQGHATCPVMYDDKVIVQVNTDKGLVLYGLDAGNGRTDWRANAEGQSWASPLVTNVNGRVQIVTAANPAIAGWDPESGRRLWSVDALKGEVVPSLVFTGGNVVAALAGSGMFGIKPDGTGLSWKLDKLPRAALPETLSPTTDGELVYVYSGTTLACVEGSMGTVVYEQEVGEQASSASPLVIADKLFLFGATKTLVVQTGREYKLLGECDLNEPVLASPAFMEGRAIIRSRNSLYCVGAPG